MGVVNELLPGGWLEFLTRCRLKHTKQFDQEAAKQQIDPGAVFAAIDAALETAMVGKKLQKDAMNAVKASVKAEIDKGSVKADDEQAIEEMAGS